MTKNPRWPEWRARAGRAARLGSVLLLAGLLAVSAERSVRAAAPADAITLLSPNNVTIAESDDYATQAFGDPWDMSNPDDIGVLSNFHIPSMQDGIWTATTYDQEGAIFLQSQGWDDSTEYVGEHSGVVYPIDPQRYSHLRVRLYSSVADHMVVFWFAAHTWTSGGDSGFLDTQPGWHIYDLDLAGNLPGHAGSWTASAWAGLRFNPTYNEGHSNVTIQLDWARLTPATAPNSSVRIAWQASGTSPVNLYVATSPNGPDEATIATGLSSSSGAYTWNNVALAPGTYYIHAVMGNASSYSGPLVINQAPTLTLTAPSPSSGEDYASTVLGKPWDMRDPTELEAYSNITAPAIGPGYLQASATSGDPQVMLLNNDPAHAINTARYHYFSYHLYLAQPQVILNGQYWWWNSGTRAIWSPQATPIDWQVTEAPIIWYNRWQFVAHDLRTVPLAVGNRGWVGALPIFRFDPHESIAVGSPNINAPFFRLGEMRLTADPTVAAGHVTTIAWTANKTAGSVTLSYTRIGGGATTQFATVPLSSGGLAWTVPASLAPGSYQISATADDGLNGFQTTALAPLVVTALAPQPCRQTFGDVYAPYDQYVNTLYCRNVVDGYLDNTFRPGAPADRGTLAQWIVRARGWAFDTTGGPHFVDVPPTNPLYPYVETAYHHNIISGYTCGGPNEPCDATNHGYFRPYASLTRGQMSKMIVNGFGWAINTSGGPHFNDADTHNPFYLQIETIVNQNLVSGYTCGSPGEPCDGQHRPYFRLGSTLTRGQLAKALALAPTP